MMRRMRDEEEGDEEDFEGEEDEGDGQTIQLLQDTKGVIRSRKSIYDF